MKVMFLGVRAGGLLESDARVVGSRCRVEVRHLLDEPSDGSAGASRLVPESWHPELGRANDAALERLLAKPRADVVVTQDRALMAAAVQLCPDAVRVVHRETSLSRVGLEALTAFAGRCDAVLADSGATAALVASAAGAMPVAIEVVPQAVEVGSVDPARTAPPTILVPQGSGSVEHLDLGIRAFGLVAGEVAPWRMRVLARRSEHRRLGRLVDELGLGDRVELAVPASDWFPEWAGASLGLLGSEVPADRMTVVAAAAAGVPVVATDWPTGVRELVVNGRDGLRVRPRSVAGLAAALVRLTSDDAQREAMGRAAQQAGERFAPSVVADQWLRVLDRVTSGGGRGTRLARVASRPVSAPPVVVATSAPTGSVEDVVRCAASVDPDWFVVPPSSSGDPLVVVLSSAARRPFLEAVAADPALRDARIELDPRDTDLTSTATDAEPVSHLRLHVDVEFWDHVAGARHAPRPNRFAAVVPDGAARSEIVVDGLRLPTLRLMAQPTFRDRPFPIDVVYTWVDGSDEEWRARRDRRLAETSAEPLARSSAGDARYVSRDEFRYSMRSLHRYAPWVRKIFVVTDRQAPPWLAEHEQVQVVDHSEILPASALPTYNSHAIEAALHRIDGLSESFLYLNDDFFLGDDVHPAELFAPNGDPMVFFSRGLVGVETEDAPPFLQAAFNNRRLIASDFGLTPTNVLQHAPFALTRRLLGEVAARYPEETHRTEHAPFRSATDISVTASLAQHLGLATGAAQVGHLTHRYVGIGSGRLARDLGRLSRRRDVQTFCLGDAHFLTLAPDRVDTLVREFLADYFPEPAPWEKQS